MNLLPHVVRVSYVCLTSIILLSLASCGVGDEKPFFKLTDSKWRIYESGDQLQYGVISAASESLGNMTVIYSSPDITTPPGRLKGQLGQALLETTTLSLPNTNSDVDERIISQNNAGALSIHRIDWPGQVRLWIAPSTGVNSSLNDVEIGQEWWPAPLNNIVSYEAKFDAHTCDSDPVTCKLAAEGTYRVDYQGTTTTDTDYGTFETYAYTYTMKLNVVHDPKIVSASRIGTVWIYPGVGVVAHSFNYDDGTKKEFGYAALRNVSFSVE